MDPTQLAQLQQLQGMYGSGQQPPPQRGQAFQPQPFQVQNRPLPPAGGGGQAAPAGAPPSGAGGGGGEQQGGGGGGWAQTLMPLMKGMQGMMRGGQQPGGQQLGGGMAGPPIVQQQGQMGPFMNQMAPPGGINPGAVTNGIVNSWPYAR